MPRMRAPACGCLPRRPTAPARAGWLERSGGALDGVIAKRLDLPTRRASGRCSRSSSSAPPTASSAASATAEKTREVGSLLLGLYDDEGLLHHVGFTSAITAADRPALTSSSKR